MLGAVCLHSQKELTRLGKDELPPGNARLLFVCLFFAVLITMAKGKK
jgi:hypothetical protein